MHFTTNCCLLLTIQILLQKDVASFTPSKIPFVIGTSSSIRGDTIQRRVRKIPTTLHASTFEGLFDNVPWPTLERLFDDVPWPTSFSDDITKKTLLNSKPPARSSSISSVAPQTLSGERDESTRNNSFNWPIASGQEQLHIATRIAKAIHEESLPWLATFILTALPAFATRSSIPFTATLMTESLFFMYCATKLVTKFNPPKLPEPILRENCEDVAELVWSSQQDIASRRDFLMGWFYDVDFEQLRREDAIAYLAWMKHGVPLEQNLLTPKQLSSLEKFDLNLLEKQTNNGKPLPLRQRDEKALPILRFNCEPLRFRHKPLVFYAVTHGVNLLLHKILQSKNFVYVPAKDAQKDLSYWYRLPDSSDNMTIDGPLVFFHGVGGLAFCYKLFDELLANKSTREKTPIVLFDLPHVSLKIHDDIPRIESQIETICRVIDNVGMRTNGTRQTKATLVGHSFGTNLVSWMVQKRPEMVAGCVFLDPICFNLHLKDILFNFHLQRVDKRAQDGRKWDNPFELASLINLAGTEMHTNNAMLRHFSWASNSLWPEDLRKHSIPATVVLTENDEIVPVSDVEDLFSNSNSNIWMNSEETNVQIFEKACHGEMFLNESLRQDTISLILDMISCSREGRINTDPIHQLKKEYMSLLETHEEFWDQISYNLSTAPTTYNKTPITDFWSKLERRVVSASN